MCTVALIINLIKDKVNCVFKDNVLCVLFTCQCLTLAFAKKFVLQNRIPEEIVIVLLVSLVMIISLRLHPRAINTTLS